VGIRVKDKKSIYLLQRTVAFIVRHVSSLEGGWKGWRRTFEAVTVRRRMELIAGCSKWAGDILVGAGQEAAAPAMCVAVYDAEFRPDSAPAS
jgi:hypothetical protein